MEHLTAWNFIEMILVWLFQDLFNGLFGQSEPDQPTGPAPAPAADLAPQPTRSPGGRTQQDLAIDQDLEPELALSSKNELEPELKPTGPTMSM